MRKHQRIFPGGSGGAVPSMIRVLGGQIDGDGLPIMRFSQTENKPETPPALAEVATVTLGVDGSGQVIVSSFTPGSGYTGDEATSVVVTGDGTSATLAITYDTEENNVSNVAVSASSSDWTEASATLPDPIGIVDTVELPDGYGVGVIVSGAGEGQLRIISHWRTNTPKWDIPGSDIEAPNGFVLLIEETITETAEDEESFPAVRVVAR